MPTDEQAAEQILKRELEISGLGMTIEQVKQIQELSKVQTEVTVPPGNTPASIIDTNAPDLSGQTAANTTALAGAIADAPGQGQAATPTPAQVAGPTGVRTLAPDTRALTTGAAGNVQGPQGVITEAAPEGGPGVERTESPGPDPSLAQESALFGDMFPPGALNEAMLLGIGILSGENIFQGLVNGFGLMGEGFKQTELRQGKEFAQEVQAQELAQKERTVDISEFQIEENAEAVKDRNNLGRQQSLTNFNVTESRFNLLRNQTSADREITLRKMRADMEVAGGQLEVAKAAESRLSQTANIARYKTISGNALEKDRQAITKWQSVVQGQLALANLEQEGIRQNWTNEQFAEKLRSNAEIQKARVALGGQQLDVQAQTSSQQNMIALMRAYNDATIRSSALEVDRTLGLKRLATADRAADANFTTASVSLIKTMQEAYKNEVFLEQTSEPFAPWLESRLRELPRLVPGTLGVLGEFVPEEGSVQQVETGRQQVSVPITDDRAIKTQIDAGAIALGLAHQGFGGVQFIGALAGYNPVDVQPEQRTAVLQEIQRRLGENGQRIEYIPGVEANLAMVVGQDSAAQQNQADIVGGFTSGGGGTTAQPEPVIPISSGGVPSAQAATGPQGVIDAAPIGQSFIQNGQTLYKQADGSLGPNPVDGS